MPISRNTAARLLVVGLLLLCALPVWAGVKVTPTKVTVTKSSPVAVLTLTNTGQRKKAFQAQAHRWRQQEGKNLLEETRELLVSPTVFELKPGSSQTLRIALRGDFPKTVEKSYRAIIRQIPTSNENGPAFGLQFALKLSIPVFATPVAATDASLQWQAELGSNGEILKVRAKNTGGRHIRLVELTVRDSSGGFVAEPMNQLTYLLPDSTREWTLSPLGAPEPGAQLAIEATSGRQTINEQLQLE